MSDGAGTECPNCGGWIHLHYAIIDGVKLLTGKCINCGEFTDIVPEDRDTGEKHMAYEDYPGKGEYIVEIRRPGQPVRGCRYESVGDALTYMRRVPTIPGGSVSTYSISGVDYRDQVRKWPLRESDYGDYEKGRNDAKDALTAEFKHSLDYGKPVTSADLRQWAEESKTIKGLYGQAVRDILVFVADALDQKSNLTYGETALFIIDWLGGDLQ